MHQLTTINLCRGHRAAHQRAQPNAAPAGELVQRQACPATQRAQQQHGIQHSSPASLHTPSPAPAPHVGCLCCPSSPQVHITYWGTPSQMLVSFVSGTPKVTNSAPTGLPELAGSRPVVQVRRGGSEKYLAPVTVSKRGCQRVRCVALVGAGLLNDTAGHNLRPNRTSINRLCRSSNLHRASRWLTVRPPTTRAITRLSTPSSIWAM